uniref:C2H2-type domain-containing protein n=1 Tax=Neogobius melanostomus TaxID=47308 RepID=A0A8C6WHD9_9GOBI
MRALVTERLTAAAEEIFALFEKTILEYEEKNQRQQQLLDEVLNPTVVLPRAGVLIPSLSPGLGLNLNILDSSQFKEEPVELSVKQEEEQLPVPVSIAFCVSQESSLLQLGEETPGEDLRSEPRFYSETNGHADHSSDTDNNDDWARPFSFSAAQTETEADGDHEDGSSQNPSAAQTEKKKHQCPSCPRGYFQKHHLRRHMVVHAEEKHYSCPVCERTFPLKCTLDSHVKSHVKGLPYSCSTCKTTFTSASSLRQHMKTIHRGHRPYSCSVCSKTFTHNSHLTDHKRIHTGDRPFRCSFCEITFIQKSNLKTHMRRHTGEKPFSCCSCEKTFIQKSQLAIHMETCSAQDRQTRVRARRKRRQTHV